jgi:peptidoglycan/LPS O-acetylase OafA/YrhL
VSSTVFQIPAADDRAQRFYRWLLGFRRITSSTQYIPEVDGLRFIALACVFIFHVAGDIIRHSQANYKALMLGDQIFWFTQRGNFGVQLFFVVSGFVLALPFAKHYLLHGKAISLRKYLARRVTRLEPPYVVALILFLALKILGSRGSVGTLLPHFWASLFYVHNLIYSTPSDINFVAWSLEIEVQFYLLAPVFAFLFFRTRRNWLRRAILVIAVFVSASIPIFLPADPRIGLSLLGQLPYFLAGVLLADVYAVDQQRSQRWWGDVVAVAAGLVIAVSLQNAWVLAFVGPIAVFTAYLGALRSLFVRRFLSLGFIATIGGMCYSIYLLHNYIIACAGYVTEPLSSGWSFESRLALQCLLLAPLVLVGSGVFFKLIEQPCMRPDWPVRAIRSLRRVLASTTAADRVQTIQ